MEYRRRDQHPAARLIGARFLEVSLLGTLLMTLVCTFAPLPAQIGALGTSVSLLAGLLVSFLERDRQREDSFLRLLQQIQIPVSLSPDHELFEHYQAYSEALSRLARQADPILRDFALLKLAQIREQLESLAEGRIVFSGTEAWRTVYDKFLESPGLKRYLSVAWVKTKDYWQDAPGRQSMAANYAALKRFIHVERIVILRDDLWPIPDRFPVPEIRDWIEDQHNHGIWTVLVRESQISSESDLLADIGIYGDRAVGTQELDDRGRTLRFVLDFDPHAVALAKDRWTRLQVYTTSYRRLLDQEEKRQ